MLKSLSKLFISSALLCATIFALNAQAQHAKNSALSVGSNVILCGPGLVFRCTPAGCFCVKP